jgi:tetraacyldisaccharide 4'-kinase
LYAKKYQLKVICVGNIYLGGTGKTPLVKKIYDELKIKEKCCILKKYHSSQSDEINLLKSNASIFVPKRRSKGLLDAISKGFQYAILDDGMQDYSFKKNKSILCIKSNKAFGNEWVLPSGPLREPLSAIKNYDISVINGENNDYIEKLLKLHNPLIKIFYSNYEIKNANNFLNRKFLAFSGIADNQSFFNLLNENNIKIDHQEEFEDHHNFTDNDMSKLIKICNKKNIELLTTEKNYFGLKEEFKSEVCYVELNLIIKNLGKFINEII